MKKSATHYTLPLLYRSNSILKKCKGGVKIFFKVLQNAQKAVKSSGGLGLKPQHFFLKNNTLKHV
jgi:hypothetical protein